MKALLSNMIVISPDNRIHFSRQAVLMLAAALVLSFCSTVFVLLTFPRVQIRDTDRSEFFHLRHETDTQWQNAYLTGTTEAGRRISSQSRLVNE
jgi:hypothetical protein